MLTPTTIRPGLLVSLRTSIKGNCRYNVTEIEADHLTIEGERRARWDTERVITDPAEHERAVKARSKARSIVAGVCAHSEFGLLCLQSRRDQLDAAVAEARNLANDFNSTASVTRLVVNVVTGTIAPDDAVAIRSINEEMRGLIDNMAEGLATLNVEKVRDAADKARSVGQMLTPDAQKQIQSAIDVARKTAREIVKASEQGAAEIDRAAIRKINESRTAFLDIDTPEFEIQSPISASRALDLEPGSEIEAAASQPRFNLEV